MPRLKAENFLKLCETKRGNPNRPKLQGVHNYDILSNPYYCDKYLYTPAVYPLRSKFVISPYAVDDPKAKDLRIQSANLVRLVVDFPYM